MSDKYGMSWHSGFEIQNFVYRNRESSHIATGYYLAVCYSATIGGCATLIGTSTNIATKGIYEK